LSILIRPISMQTYYSIFVIFKKISMLKFPNDNKREFREYAFSNVSEKLLHIENSQYKIFRHEPQNEKAPAPVKNTLDLSQTALNEFQDFLSTNFSFSDIDLMHSHLEAVLDTVEDTSIQSIQSQKYEDLISVIEILQLISVDTRTKLLADIEELRSKFEKYVQGQEFLSILTIFRNLHRLHRLEAVNRVLKVFEQLNKLVKNYRHLSTELYQDGNYTVLLEILMSTRQSCRKHSVAPATFPCMSGSLEWLDSTIENAIDVGIDWCSRQVLTREMLSENFDSENVSVEISKFLRHIDSESWENVKEKLNTSISSTLLENLQKFQDFSKFLDIFFVLAEIFAREIDKKQWSASRDSVSLMYGELFEHSLVQFAQFVVHENKNKLENDIEMTFRIHTILNAYATLPIEYATITNIMLDHFAHFHENACEKIQVFIQQHESWQLDKNLKKTNTVHLFSELLLEYSRKIEQCKKKEIEFCLTYERVHRFLSLVYESIAKSIVIGSREKITCANICIAYNTLVECREEFQLKMLDCFDLRENEYCRENFIHSSNLLVEKIVWIGTEASRNTLDKGVDVCMNNINRMLRIVRAKSPELSERVSRELCIAIFSDCFEQESIGEELICDFVNGNQQKFIIELKKCSREKIIALENPKQKSKIIKERLTTLSKFAFADKHKTYNGKTSQNKNEKK